MGTRFHYARSAVTVLVVGIVPWISTSANEVDPLAPAGIEIGMSISDADVTLTKAGYRKLAGCLYTARTGEGSMNVTLGLDGRGCNGETVAQITYEQNGFPLSGQPSEVIHGVDERFGGGANCLRLDEISALCLWQSAPSDPRLGQITVEIDVSPPTLKLILNAPRGR